MVRANPHFGPIFIHVGVMFTLALNQGLCPLKATWRNRVYSVEKLSLSAYDGTEIMIQD